MKYENIYELEELNLEDWSLISESPSLKIYRKANLEKHIAISENYTLEYNYKDKQLHGTTIGRMNKPFLHYPNSKSKIYLIENYHEGKLEGLSHSFFDDGSRVQQEWKNDQPNGKEEQWFGNGQKEKEKHYINGELSGVHYEWYENGQLKLEQNFFNGTQIDVCLEYLENGNLKRKKFYKNGLINGIVYVLWDFRGNLVDGGVYSETEYQNDMKHGKEIVFYPNGTKMRAGNCKNGEEEGERIWWNKNGTISIKEFYKNGELDGERFLYDDHGQLESVQLYENGNRLS